jgi:hypothetical protein
MLSFLTTEYGTQTPPGNGPGGVARLRQLVVRSGSYYFVLFLFSIRMLLPSRHVVSRRCSLFTTNVFMPLNIYHQVPVLLKRAQLREQQRLAQVEAARRDLKRRLAAVTAATAATVPEFDEPPAKKRRR